MSAHYPVTIVMNGQVVGIALTSDPAMRGRSIDVTPEAP